MRIRLRFILVVLAILEMAASGWGQVENPVIARLNADMKDLAPVLSRTDLAQPSISESIKTYDRFLEAHPQNMLARFNRASLLINVGRLSSARSDLDQLERAGFPSSSLNQTKARLASLAGLLADELAAYEKLSEPMEPGDPSAQDQAMQASWKVESKLASFRVLELKGNQNATAAAWQEFLKDDANGVFLSDYGNYLVRQGQFDAAVKVFSEDLSSIPKNQPSVDVTAAARLRLSTALWACGRLEEAEKQSSLTMRLLLESREDTGHTSYFLPQSLFVTLTLARQGIGGAGDKTAATGALAMLAERLEGDEYLENDNLLAVLSGKLSKAKANIQLETILKESPRLEWALWSETYLGLMSREDAERIVTLTPNPSIQRAILSRYRDDPASK